MAARQLRSVGQAARIVAPNLMVDCATAEVLRAFDVVGVQSVLVKLPPSSDGSTTPTSRGRTSTATSSCGRSTRRQRRPSSPSSASSRTSTRGTWRAAAELAACTRRDARVRDRTALGPEGTGLCVRPRPSHRAAPSMWYSGPAPRHQWLSGSSSSHGRGARASECRSCATRWRHRRRSCELGRRSPVEAGWVCSSRTLRGRCGLFAEHPPDSAPGRPLAGASGTDVRWGRRPSAHLAGPTRTAQTTGAARFALATSAMISSSA